MPDYQLGKIYKITSGDLTYIGSTCEPTLAKRLAKHVTNYKVFQTGKGGSHVSSYQLIETGVYTITLIEIFPCGSKDELTARERFHIENTTCVNRNVPNRKMKEWRLVNQDIIKEQNKIWYETNKDKVAEYREKNKETRYKQANKKVTCDCGLIYNHSNKIRHELSKKHLEFKPII